MTISPISRRISDRRRRRSHRVGDFDGTETTTTTTTTTTTATMTMMKQHHKRRRSRRNTKVTTSSSIKNASSSSHRRRRRKNITSLIYNSSLLRRRYFIIFFLSIILIVLSSITIVRYGRMIEISTTVDVVDSDDVIYYPFYFHIMNYTATTTESSSFVQVPSSYSTIGKNHTLLLHDDINEEEEEDYQVYEEYRNSLLRKLDSHHEDNKNLPRRTYYHDEELQDDPPRNCHRPNWKSKFYSTCNTFHEQSLALDIIAGDKLQFRGSGYYRDAWTLLQQQQLQQPHNDDDENDQELVVVLKTLRHHVHPISIKQIIQMAKEAIIMERLSSSPYIVNIYGYCGVSTLVESMTYEIDDEIHTKLDRHEIQQYYNNQHERRYYHYHDDDNNNDTFGMQQQQQQQPPPLPLTSPLHFLNNLTSIEKLNMVVDIAKSLADIHGYNGGVILHADTHPCQWLRNNRGQIKLNDFNNAIILDWDYSNEQYCVEQHHLAGTFRSPEEHKGQWTIDEKSEIYAMGGMIYTILMGVYPFWEYHKNERHDFIRTGSLLPPPIVGDNDWVKMKSTSSSSSSSKQQQQLQLLQNHYPIEYALIQIMKKCYIYDQKSRPDIFQILHWLREIQV